MNTRTNARGNDAGNYEFPLLPPDIYRIEVEAAGFKRYSRQPVEVRAWDAIALDITLEAGAISAAIDVSFRQACIRQEARHFELHPSAIGESDSAGGGRDSVRLPRMARVRTFLAAWTGAVWAIRASPVWPRSSRAGRMRRFYGDLSRGEIDGFQHKPRTSAYMAPQYR